MMMIYKHENNFIVNNVKNLVEAQDIKTFIKNEFVQGALGEVSAFDSWPEVWIFDDADYDCALVIVNAAQSSTKAADWICNNCTEQNDPSFEVCWNCQQGNS